MRLTNLRCVFFDVGYTLVNEDAVWRQRCREQADHEEARRLGLTADMLMEEIREATRAYRPQYRTVLEKYRFTWQAPYRHELEVLDSNADRVLRALSGRYTLGIIANQSEGLMERLRAWGIDAYFPIVMSSWDAGVMKPDERIFRMALERAGCEAAECAMVGDRLDNDVAPAKAVGMRTIWVRQGFGGQQVPASDAHTPDADVAGLDALLDIL